MPSTKPKDTEDTAKPQGVNHEEPTEHSKETSGKTEPAVKGTLEMKTYTLKKKTDTKQQSFKCSECAIVKKSIKELNIHHEESHNRQICCIYGKLFKLVSSLSRHMYDHNAIRYHCDQCDYGCHFESELHTHKIIHRKNPSHKCMKVNCGKWFMHKWDLTLHLQKHDGTRHECDYDGCKFSTDTKKQLKEHLKSHLDDCQYLCAEYRKGFKYRSGLKRHRDNDHDKKWHKTLYLWYLYSTLIVALRSYELGVYYVKKILFSISFIVL